jgi:hypothetical protein
MCEVLAYTGPQGVATTQRLKDGNGTELGAWCEGGKRLCPDGGIEIHVVFAEHEYVVLGRGR